MQASRTFPRSAPRLSTIFVLAASLFIPFTVVMAELDAAAPGTEEDLTAIKAEYSAGEFESVVGHSQKFLKARPKGALAMKAHILLGRALARLHRDEEAITSFQRVIDLGPESELSEEALFLIIADQSAAKHYNSILTSYQFIMRHLPPSESQWRAFSFLLVADAFSAQDKFEEATAVCNIALNISLSGRPAKFFASARIAEGEKNLGNDAKAAEWKNRVRLMAANGGLEAAMEKLNEDSLELTPFSKEGLAELVKNMGGAAETGAALAASPGTPPPQGPSVRLPSPEPLITREQANEMAREAAKQALAAQKAETEKSEPRTVSSDVDAPRHRLKSLSDDFAVVVGVEKYSTELPEAQYAERDAVAVKAHLLAMGLPERNIKLLRGNQATRGRLEGALEDWLPRMAKAEGRVFFYFSGHGAPDPASRQAFLVPWDGDPSLLSRTALPLKQVYKSLNALKAKRVIVALDSCFSGAGGRSVLPEGTRPLVNMVDTAIGQTGKIVLFAASGSNEITGSLKEQGHGLFTYYFLKGLGGEAKDSSGVVTLGGLYDYLKPKVQDEASRQNREQTPVLEGAGNEPLVRFQ